MRLSVMAGLSGKCEEQMAAWLRMRDDWHAQDLDEVARQAQSPSLFDVHDLQHKGTQGRVWGAKIRGF